MPLQVSQDEDGFGLSPLVPGRLMAHHYVAFATMTLMAGAPPRSSMPDLLLIICRAHEFQHIRLRR